MNIHETLKAKMIASSKARDGKALELYRFLKGQFDLKPVQPFPEEDAHKVIRGYINQSKVEKTSFTDYDLALMDELIPALLSEEEVMAVLSPEVAKIQSIPSDGAAMGIAMKMLKGKPVDALLVKKLVGEMRGQSEN